MPISERIGRAKEKALFYMEVYHTVHAMNITRLKEAGGIHDTPPLEQTSYPIPQAQEHVP
ncbi:hypothetical protein JCM10914A_15840 [Paenibacillus sp. JCM 10914]